MSLRLLAAAAVAALSATTAHAAPAPPKSVELYAMDCGRMTIPNADMFADDGAYKDRPAKMVVPCYLIRHPKGDLMWDVGLASPPPPGEGAAATRKLTDQLKDVGLAPKDIEFLSVSHGHFDHIGNGGLFAASTWIVDPREREFLFRDAARKDSLNFPTYSALETTKTVLVDQPSHDVFGDKTVVVYRAPGHTPGHTVLLVRTKGAGAVLLTGDMYHIAESRAGRKVPRFNFNRAQTLASMDLVEKLAADTKARVVREHVIEDFDALPKFPQPLK